MDFIEQIKNIGRLYPDHTAIIDNEEKISYSEFLKLVDNISHYLLKVNPQIRVAVDIRQGIYAYATIIAVLQIGGTYCPLHPEAPDDRKRQILDEFKPDVLIRDKELSEDMRGRYTVANTSDIMKGGAPRPVEIIYDPESTIYVIYTSGSTGTPKGVMISRKALNKFLEWSVPTYAAGKQDIWAQYSFLSFDLSIVDIFTCLCSGATLLAMPNLPDKLRPTQTVAENKVTIWHSVPSVVELMIKSEESRAADLSSLKLMSFCGEPLKKHQMEFLFNKKEDLLIFNTYGPTEGTLFCTCQELNKANYLEYFEYTMSIGRPITGWQFDYLDSDDQEVKEVVIYGDYIGKGYLVPPSDSKFKKRNINGVDQDVFETGDLVIEKNGNLYFAGRKDRQVKIKGNRVEPDEIDSWIVSIIKKNSITVFYDEALYTFIETSGPIDEVLLRKELLQKIEQYKMPRAFQVIDKLPRNSNLKVNYSALIELLQ